MCRCLNFMSPPCFAHLISHFLSGIIRDPARRCVDLLPAACPHVREDDPGVTLFSTVCLCVNLKLSEFLLQVSMFCHGARVGFYQGDISLLMDDIKTLKPTFFPVVPRLLNRIYDKVCIQSSPQKAPFLVCLWRLMCVVADFCEDPGLGDLSAATGLASLCGEEEAGRAPKRDCTQQQLVGQTGLQQDSGELLTAFFMSSYITFSHIVALLSFYERRLLQNCFSLLCTYTCRLFTPLSSVLNDIFSGNLELYSCHYLCRVLLNTVLHVDQQLCRSSTNLYPNFREERLFQRSMPNSPRAYWPCGSVLEKHAHRQTRAERFWLGVANADGKIWPKLKMVKMEFSLFHQNEWVSELFCMYYLCFRPV